jgi:hypothetical protein
MVSDTTMHDEQNNNKRPIAEISDTKPEEVQQSNKRSARAETEHGETETPRAETTDDTAVSESESESKAEGLAALSGLSGIPGLPGLPGLAGLGGITMCRPRKHENVVRIAAGTKPAYRAYRAYRPFYVSGLGPGQEKEGLAISAHLDHDAPDSFTWSAEEIAERRAEVREKLAYMLGATWQSFMGVDFPGSGHGTIQCFSSYYTLVAA